MIARRAAWDLTPNALAARVAERRSAGLPVIDLSDSNPTHCGIDAPAAALREALAELAGDPEALRYEPDPRGGIAARAAIADYHARGAGETTADRVVLTAGTSEGYAHLFRLLADPGDRIHLPSPGYALFAHLAELEGLEVAPYPLRPPARAGEAGWRIDLDALAADLSPCSRAIVAIDPHNPTGSFVRATDRASLASIADERGLALVVDEVFSDYASDSAARRRARVEGDAGPLRFVLSGASKVLGLPQLKLAWIVAEGPAAVRDDALARLEFVADAFLSVSPLLASLLPRLLARRESIQAEIRARVAANRARLAEALRDVGGAGLLPAEAGWSAIVRLHGQAGPIDEEAFALALLEAHGVLVQPGFLFDLDPHDGAGRPCAHLILSLLPDPDRFGRGIEALVSLTCGRPAAPG